MWGHCSAFGEEVCVWQSTSLPFNMCLAKSKKLCQVSMEKFESFARNAIDSGNNVIVSLKEVIISYKMFLNKISLISSTGIIQICSC